MLGRASIAEPFSELLWYGYGREIIPLCQRGKSVNLNQTEKYFKVFWCGADVVAYMQYSMQRVSVGAHLLAFVPDERGCAKE